MKYKFKIGDFVEVDFALKTEVVKILKRTKQYIDGTRHASYVEKHAIPYNCYHPTCSNKSIWTWKYCR